MCIIIIFKFTINNIISKVKMNWKNETLTNKFLIRNKRTPHIDYLFTWILHNISNISQSCKNSKFSFTKKRFPVICFSLSKNFLSLHLSKFAFTNSFSNFLSSFRLCYFPSISSNIYSLHKSIKSFDGFFIRKN